jgi:hypothetical protein
MSHGDHKQITIRGIIVPSEWDDTGNVTSISISTFNEDEYLVDKDSISKKLQYYMREGVEASGFVREEEGIKRIKINRYRIKNMPLISS